MVNMNKLLINNGKEEAEIPTKTFSDPSKLRPLLNSECWLVFQKILEKPSFPALLAKELSMNEQKVYYYIKQLRNSDLIHLEKTEERNGAFAKYYSAVSTSFSIVPNLQSMAKQSGIVSGRGKDPKTPEILKEFSKNGSFSGKIVVGSPDPHGFFKARARDGHLAAELTAFIGSNFSGFDTPLVYLDTMVKDIKEENSNLIILGGPVTNKLCDQVKKYLPIKFVPSGGNWIIKSDLSGKEYSDDSTGVIEKISHPFFKNRCIMVLAGKRNAGTIAAIIALSKKTKQASKPNNFDGKTFAKVVEGLDVNGDGLIDEVEFRE